MPWLCTMRKRGQTPMYTHPFAFRILSERSISYPEPACNGFNLLLMIWHCVDEQQGSHVSHWSRRPPVPLIFPATTKLSSERKIGVRKGANWHHGSMITSLTAWHEWCHHITGDTLAFYQNSVVKLSSFGCMLECHQQQDNVTCGPARSYVTTLQATSLCCQQGPPTYLVSLLLAANLMLATLVAGRTRTLSGRKSKMWFCSCSPLPHKI